MDTFVVKRLAQARLLSDPFKLKLLEGFAGAPATTKQVADRMGEKAPRLYRHVDALVDEGLLTLVEERPKRGTVERYFKTVAARFEVDPELFSPSHGESSDAIDLMRSIFRDTESDLLHYFENHHEETSDHDELPLVMKVAVRGSATEIAALRQKLEAWLAECEAMTTSAEDAESNRSYTGLLAFYPNERGE